MQPTLLLPSSSPPPSPPRAPGSVRSAPLIRDATPGDYAAMLEINNAAYPAMNSHDPDSFARLLSSAAYVRVVEDDRGIAAFLIGFAPGAPYESANYRWFCEQYAEFLYVDRIAVAAHAQGAGLGSSLYDDIARFASGRWPCLVAEVNSDPPNPGSVRFHERHGFIKVGELDHTSTGAHASSVTMLRRDLVLRP